MMAFISGHVNNVFLHCDLHEEVYMAPPHGLQCSPNLVCRLNKSLYGLKQASRQWFAKLHFELKQQGFQQSQYDHFLFIHRSNGCITLAAMHVDDIILNGNLLKA